MKTAAIGSFMVDDWINVGPDGSIDGREAFLSLITYARCRAMDARPTTQGRDGSPEDGY